MKTKNLVSTFLLLSSFCISNLALALTPEHKDELYKKGTITIVNDEGKEEGHFEVRFMPGAENVKADATKQWEEAGKLMEAFIDKSFWEKKVYGSMCDGMNYVKKGVYDEGVCAIPSDFTSTCAANQRIAGSFGSTAGQAKNWIKFGGQCVARTCMSIWGLCAGSTYAVLAPTFWLLSRPIGALGHGLVGGAVVPAMKFTWNGVAWVATKDNAEPKAGDMTVHWYKNYAR